MSFQLYCRHIHTAALLLFGKQLGTMRAQDFKKFPITKVARVGVYSAEI